MLTDSTADFVRRVDRKGCEREQEVSRGTERERKGGRKGRTFAVIENFAGRSASGSTR